MSRMPFRWPGRRPPPSGAWRQPMSASSDPNCPFCFPDKARVFHEGDLVLGIWDAYPVSEGHALLVLRRHVASWFDATDSERRALTDAVDLARRAIEKDHAPH